MQTGSHRLLLALQFDTFGRVLLEPGNHVRLLQTSGAGQCPELEHMAINGLGGFQVELLKRGSRVAPTHFCSGGGGGTLVEVV